MKQWIKLTVPVIAMAVSGLSAHADLINGTIQMSGGVTFNSQNLASATTASFGTPAGVVQVGTGSFAAVTPLVTTVNFQGFNFAGAFPQTEPISQLWSFTSGGLLYSFDLAQINSATVSNKGQSQFLDIEGTGLVDITGAGSPYTATPATWSFTVTDSSGGTSGSFIFGFSDSNTSIPDGGMTVMMLGAALTGLGLIKRKLA
jgi:hypothetical protein